MVYYKFRLSRNHRSNYVKPMRYHTMDIESRFGLQPEWGTSVISWFSGLIAILLSVSFYTLLTSLPENPFTAVFLNRGPTQYGCVLLGFWCFTILTLKRHKLRIQERALKHTVVPANQSFILTSQTADQVVRKIYENTNNPEKFIAYNRILIAISSIKNLGRVSDVDEILQSIAERDENAHETSFGLVNGFLWAIPVLGFIGTVLGLSISIANFSKLLEKQKEVSSIVNSLKEVTAGLSTAFETTLVALLFALAIQLWVTIQKGAEERFLIRVDEYCMQQITCNIRILQFEQSREV